MLGRTYESQDCSAARALEFAGERWSLLIVRDALFAGTTRFTDFQRSLGLARNVLAARLERFVEDGLMERRLPEPGAQHHDYVLTDKGRELQPVIIALTRWGDRWAAPDGPPVVYRHSTCEGPVEQHTVCGRCGESVAGDEIEKHRTRPPIPPAAR
ncbi:winged helix-turn-helix transcriptional regulator [Actinacidiphila bryophytorum]|uniref:winged helix-turn-helix transcriptional regulator n=1 Tax=Actinacidiphila bryophytorum TaxID=1436133 RepID=UPI002176D38B|nr:helix-turn-helix domain-containing protein [Actinacidiphila bryophytorum]UWE11619.1 helix-turn-helix transcriptional regulator [Actinacidiphila bryophytorum]